MVVSSVSMGVARVVVTQRKVRKVLLLLLLMMKNCDAAKTVLFSRHWEGEFL